jgi:quercetin dioxygenase-like cupin family protein
MMKKVALVVGLLLVGFLGGTLAAKEKAKKEILQQTVADLQWKEAAPGMPIMTSEVMKGPGGSNCAFNKFPKGFAVPLHWHTKDIHAVVISGNWGSTAEGAPEKLVAPGGYQLIPGGLKHSTKCGDAADCVIYQCSPGAFDLKGLPPPPK